jgi:hypothetical protein
MSEPTVDVLRESVRRAVAASSLRAVAEQVGLTHRGLALFIEGSKPRPSTVRKLTAWSLGRPRGAEAVSREDAEAVLAILLAGVPPERMDAAVRRVVTGMRRVCVDAGVPPPAWIDASLARRG